MRIDVASTPSADRRFLRVAKRKLLATRTIATQGLYHACRQSDFIWRYGPNFKSWLSYQSIRTPLGAVHERLLSALKRDGIVLTSVRELMGDTTLYDELERAVSEYEAALADDLNQARTNMNTPGHVKSYLIKLLGSRPMLDPSSIFARLALHSGVLDIVNGYFGMLTKLRHYNVWHNFPTEAEPRESQLWHRDPEDRYVFKMFVYLTHVDEGCGPLTYAVGTHAQGTVKRAPSANLYQEGSSSAVQRSDDAQMSAVVPKEQWITATGPRGTAVLVDTRGYHKGGLARERDRIVYVCAFTSTASTLLEDVFERQLLPPVNFDRAAAFAITG